MTRRLQTDQALEGVGLLIFDEFHERSLDADLGLAFALETREALRPDLRILIMSATLEAEALQRLFGQAAIVRSKGRQFPVETRYLGRATRQTVAADVASAVKLALGREKGSILAFLPGEAEIAEPKISFAPSTDIRLCGCCRFMDRSALRSRIALSPLPSRASGRLFWQRPSRKRVRPSKGSTS